MDPPERRLYTRSAQHATADAQGLSGDVGTEITSKDMISWDVTIQDLMVKIRECFNAAGFEAEENEDNAGDDNEGN